MDYNKNCMMTITGHLEPLRVMFDLASVLGIFNFWSTFWLDGPVLTIKGRLELFEVI